MSRHEQRLWPVWMVLIAAVALSALPLPDMLQPVRPPLAAMTVIYWSMMWPQRFGLGSAWVVGLLLDILQGTLLGQHAIALAIIAYLTLKFHLQIRIFPLWQLTVTVFALLAIDSLIVLLIDGYAGNPLGGLARWSQVLTGAILWPIVMALMDRIREQLKSQDRTII